MISWSAEGFSRLYFMRLYIKLVSDLTGRKADLSKGYLYEPLLPQL